MINELNEKLNLSGVDRLTTFKDMHYYIDAYIALEFNQRPHKVQLSNEFKRNIDHYEYLLLYHMMFRDDFGVRISTHNFFSLMNSLISHKIGVSSPSDETEVTKTVPKDAKYYLFSAHDTTLVSFISGIGHKGSFITDGAESTSSFPQYAASIIIELHKTEEKGYFLKWLFNGKKLDINGL